MISASLPLLRGLGGSDAQPSIIYLLTPLGLDVDRRIVPHIILGELFSDSYSLVAAICRRRQFYFVPPLVSLGMALTDNFPCMILHRRNLACIGCGCPRPGQRTPSPNSQTSIMQQSNRLPSSPRFISPPNSRINTSVNFSSHQSSMSPMHSPSTFNFTPQGSSPLSQGGPSLSVSQHPHSSAGKPPSPVHHLLTPSGRSFSVGGKVQNISTDPLSPCVMYWPDNEAFPEQGQIRPSIVMGVPVCYSHSFMIV